MKLKSLEEIIQMPEISRDDINKIKSDIKNTQATIEKIEAKLKQSANKNSELTVYKQNALNAANLKESALKILKNSENEKNLIERKYADLERKFEQSKGFKYVRKDDLFQKAENMKKKKETFQKLSKILDGYSGEGLVLDKSIKILKSKSSDYEEILQKIEEKQGISGYKNVKQELEELSKKKIEIDQSKALTLEEYSKLILQFQQKIKETQEKNAPLLDKLNKIKVEYEQLLPSYNTKKNAYENAIADSQSAFLKTKEEYEKSEQEFRNFQNKYFTMQMNIKYNDEMIKRYESETYYLNKNEKRLNEKFKSFKDYYSAYITEQDTFLSDLKDKQKHIKETYDDNLRQVILCNSAQIL